MRPLHYCYLILIGLLFSGCSNSGNGVGNIQDSGSVPSRAKRFTIENKDGYKILTIINPWQGANGVMHKWYLVEKGKEAPAGTDAPEIIYTPVESIICMSTTYIPMIKALGEADAIRGISGSSLIYDDQLRSLVHSGKIADVGYEDNLNKELLIRIAPELLMVYGVGSEAAGYMNKVRDLGIKVIFNADYLETDPLGKAEWIKVFGALFGRETEADRLYENIEKEYLYIKEYVGANIKNRPKVLMGLPWKDSWFISPGNSFSSNLIADAGGSYLYENLISEVSQPFGLENVWYKALNADLWINPGAAKSIAEIISLDGRLGELPCVMKGNIYNNNNRISIEGGNDYWEGGSLLPQVILKDLASIMHPELFPGYMPVFYKKIN